MGLYDLDPGLDSINNFIPDDEIDSLSLQKTHRIQGPSRRLESSQLYRAHILGGGKQGKPVVWKDSGMSRCKRSDGGWKGGSGASGMPHAIDEAVASVRPETSPETRSFLEGRRKRLCLIFKSYVF